MSAPLTLAIDLSGPGGGVALGCAGGEIVWERDFATGPTAGGELFVALERCLAAGPSPERLVVGVGPGSYAGVRMAIAAATGLGLALEVEVIALPSVCAYDVDGPGFHAVGDARRGAFYYTEVQGGSCRRGPEICDLDEVHDRIATRPDWPVFSVEPLPDFPLAQRTAAKAARLLTAPAETTPRPLEPIYLREPHITSARVSVR
jgi:tRNA threonylcarbamoyladenosine biosynthesis protein TsaB